MEYIPKQSVVQDLLGGNVSKTEGQNHENDSEDTARVVTPSPKLRILYIDYLAIVVIGTFLSWFIPLFMILYMSGHLEFAVSLTTWSALILLPTVIIATYWIAKYTRSLKFEFTSKEVVVSKGVWWRKKNIVQYNRITNIDVEQGPLSRHHSIAKVQLQTAGYSGSPGGGRRSEATILGVENYDEIKEMVLKFIHGVSPSIAVESEHTRNLPTVEDLLKEILAEIRKSGKNKT